MIYTYSYVHLYVHGCVNIIFISAFCYRLSCEVLLQKPFNVIKKEKDGKNRKKTLTHAGFKSLLLLWAGFLCQNKFICCERKSVVEFHKLQK